MSKQVIERDDEYLEQPWDESDQVTDWSAFPHGYGLLLNERLQFPCDLSVCRMKLDRSRQLFVDDHLIAHTEHVKREFHQPVDHPANPLITDVFPRYVIDMGDDAVAGGKYRVYYNTGGWLLYVAYSDDGVNWTKPVLDLIDPADYGDRVPPNFRNDRNLICDGEIHGLIDEPDDPDPSQRYKAIIRPKTYRERKWPYLKRNPSFGADKPHNQIPYFLYTSPDGLRWTFKAETSITWDSGMGDMIAPHTRPLGTGDCLGVRWDPVLQKYVAETKHFIGPDMRMTPVHHTARVVGMCESDDLIHFSSPRMVAYPDGEDAKMPGMWGIYQADGFAYESMWLNCYSMSCYHPASIEQRREMDLMPARPYLKRNWLRLAGSRDGRHWSYLGRREPFIELGTEESWKPHYLRMCTRDTIGGPVVRDDKLWFYYRGASVDGAKNTWRSGLGIAILRRDGFASCNAATPGIVITRPFVFEGDGELHLNADVASGGYVGVSVLDEDGGPIDGFDKSDCQPCDEDTTRCRIGWSGHDTLAPLRDQYIRLAFHIKDAKLYSFWIE